MNKYKKKRLRNA